MVICGGKLDMHLNIFKPLFLDHTHTHKMQTQPSRKKLFIKSLALNVYITIYNRWLLSARLAFELTLQWFSRHILMCVCVCVCACLLCVYVSWYPQRDQHLQPVKSFQEQQDAVRCSLAHLHRERQRKLFYGLAAARFNQTSSLFIKKKKKKAAALWGFR